MLVRNVSGEPRLVLLKEHAPQVVPSGELVGVDEEAGRMMVSNEPGIWAVEHVLVPPPPAELKEA